jgi:hypothetical protein
LIKDIVEQIKWLHSLDEKCRLIVCFFKKSNLIGYSFRELRHARSLRIPTLPAGTRWGVGGSRGVERCFATVLASEEVLLEIVSLRGFLQVENKKRQKRRNIQGWARDADFVSQLNRAVERSSTSACLPDLTLRTATRLVWDTFRTHNTAGCV